MSASIRCELCGEPATTFVPGDGRSFARLCDDHGRARVRVERDREEEDRIEALRASGGSPAHNRKSAERRAETRASARRLPLDGRF